MFYEAAFLISVACLVYIYAGYPAAAWLLSRLRSRPVVKSPHRPFVTVLIAAYNEGAQIRSTLANKLELDYPGDRLEIVVVSDGSTDHTGRIVREFEEPVVRLVEQEIRQGKTAALNRGVAESRGEIIVFADANSIYRSDALSRLIENFVDPTVGYVTGKMIYTDATGSVIGDGCSAYMRYENRLRDYETQLGSVVGVDGGIDAVRRSLYRPMRADQLPDFVLPLMVVEQGYRVVYEPRAILEEPSLSSAADEYRMRVRVSLRALWALHDMRKLLNVFRFGIFSWQLLSHKVLRYAGFLFLLSALLSSMMLWNRGQWWRAALLVQLAGYAATLLFHRLKKWGVRARVLSLPYYFTLINLASAHAFMKYVSGRKQVLWTPRKG